MADDRCDYCGKWNDLHAHNCIHRTGPKKRRVRSRMSKADAVQAVSDFGAKMIRLMETAQDFDNPREQSARGTMSVVFRVPGSFGTADDFFEALRVLGGHMLPRKP